MSRMIYNYPQNIYFHWGESKNTGEHATELGGRRALIVTDKGVRQVGLLDDICTSLDAAKIAYTVFDGVQPNPTDLNVADGLNLYHSEGCDIVIAVGGGSPMDAAKGIILMTKHPGIIKEYFTGEPNRRPITGAVPPFMAVPTTSGTGSEVSRGGIISDTQENRKRVISSKHLLPKTVILDPSLTETMPPQLTAYTGLDALSHNVEAIAVDAYAPICDAFAKTGIELIHRSLFKAYSDGSDRGARRDMMYASSLGAMAFQKGLGVVHSLAHQLSPQIGVPHGAACGIMLPYAIRYNLQAESTIPKYSEVAQQLGAAPGGQRAMAYQAPQLVERLLEQLGVPKTLKDWNVTEEDIEIMAKNAMLDHCHPRNPRPCTEEAMTRFYRDAQ
ncbi:MAG: iron-containing alcohol dehydrogenase [Candidatus Bathyarchaeota archaeon]|nr:iron-containing alcohol dehydrogenase [Candidatus Bathyarchaeota archaeon]